MNAGRLSLSPDRRTVRDSQQVTVLKLSERNPGAMNVLIQSLQLSAKVDPKNGFGNLGFATLCDFFGVYGEQLWMLYADVCRSRYERAHAVLRAVQLGLIPETLLHNWLDGRVPLPDIAVVDTLITQVRHSIPEFAPEGWDAA